MALLLPTSSFKTTSTVVIAGVLIFASAVILTVPSVSHFVWSCFPVLYDNTVFLVKPPYLYLVINCIIVCIVATSKLTHKSTSIDDSEVVIPVPLPVPVPSDIDIGYLNVVHVASDYTGFVEKNDVRDRDDLTVEDGRKFPEVIAVGKEHSPELKTEMPNSSSDSPELETEMPNSSSDLPELETEIPNLSSDSPELETEKPKLKNDSPEISILRHSKKPPRFNQQKSLKSNPEGGNKKTALGVTKPPRREDTLDTTWKKITEGRSTPLTKHLTKSDTWQERTQEKPKEKMTNSENLNDISTPTEEKTPLKREPSPGQEELNRRVEAFIKKFNEEMRLQRLESLAKYNEMVNGGTRL